MAYEISWLIEKRVILARVYGVADLKTLTELGQSEQAMMAQGIPLVHLISDTTDVDKVEVNLKTLQKLVKPLKTPEGVGWYIDVSPHQVNRMITSIALQFAGLRHREFATLDEAIAFLQTNDNSLPPMEIPGQYDETPSHLEDQP